jgi:hypothetical protein
MNPNRCSLFMPERDECGYPWRLTFGRASHRRLWRGFAARSGGWERSPREAFLGMKEGVIRLSGGYSPLRKRVADFAVEEVGLNHRLFFGSTKPNFMGVTGLEPVTSALSRRRSPN